MPRKAPDLQGRYLLDLLEKYGGMRELHRSKEIGGRLAWSTLQKRIYEAQDEAGIPRPRGGTVRRVDKPCENCGALMAGVVSYQQYCSRTCRNEAASRNRTARERRQKRERKDEPLYGSWTGGCEGCKHVLRCRWLVERGRHEPAERTHIICEVPRSIAARVADAIDAQPGYRAWLATQDHQLELIEEAA